MLCGGPCAASDSTAARVLEPGAGHRSLSLAGNRLTLLSVQPRVGVEIDNTTAGILKHLYQNAVTYNIGYQEAPLARNFFRLVISTSPFFEKGVSDPLFNKPFPFLRRTLHDYYFAKSVELAQPGGVIAFITSLGTMDKPGIEVRKWLAERTELLGAFRLPRDRVQGERKY